MNEPPSSWGETGGGYSAGARGRGGGQFLRAALEDDDDEEERRAKDREEKRAGRRRERRTRSESGDAPGKLVMPALSASRTRALLRAGRKKARVNSARGGGGGARGREERRTKPRRCCASTRSAPRRAASLPHGCHLQVHEFSISTRACEGEADERERRTDLLVRSSLQLLDVGRVGARVGGGAQAGDARLPGFSESLRAREEEEVRRRSGRGTA